MQTNPVVAPGPIKISSQAGRLQTKANTGDILGALKRQEHLG